MATNQKRALEGRRPSSPVDSEVSWCRSRSPSPGPGSHTLTPRHTTSPEPSDAANCGGRSTDSRPADLGSALVSDCESTVRGSVDKYTCKATRPSPEQKSPHLVIPNKGSELHTQAAASSPGVSRKRGSVFSRAWKSLSNASPPPSCDAKLTESPPVPQKHDSLRSVRSSSSVKNLQVKAALLETQLQQVLQENEAIASCLQSTQAEVSQWQLQGVQLKRSLHRAKQRLAALEAENATLRELKQDMEAAMKRMAVQLRSYERRAAEAEVDLCTTRAAMDDFRESLRWFG
eukprot:RCo000964